MAYDIGDQIRLQTTFALSGTAADPTTITLTVRDPSGNSDSYTYALGTVSKSSTGIYYKDITLDEAGTWFYRWAGTGAVVAVVEGSLAVQRSYMTATNDYATLQELKGVTPDVTWSDTYDTIASRLISAASRAVDALLKREPGAFAVQSDTTRYFTGSGRPELWVGEMAAAPTSVSVAESGVLTSLTAWASTDYICWPYNALLEGMPYLRLDIDEINGSKSVWYSYPKAVKIVGKFGFSTTPPEEITQATITQAMRWLKRGQQAYQDAGAVAELGQMVYVRKLDPDIETALSLAKFQRVTI